MPAQVDDVGNPDWLGVDDAVVYFARTQKAMAPFLWACGKMYFTTAAAHKFYYEFALTHPCLRCTANDRQSPAKNIPSSRSLGGWNICMHTRKACDCVV